MLYCSIRKLHIQENWLLLNRESPFHVLIGVEVSW
jgi:hypothetical protein